MYEQPKSKKELYETAMTGEKALTSLMYVQMTLYAAKSQKTYARVRSEGVQGCATRGFI